jgi:hypothetical protein
MDTNIRTFQNKSLVQSVFESISKYETVLNQGNTIRLSVLDTVGRKKWNVGGYKLNIHDDDKYFKQMMSQCSHFDRAYHVQNDNVTAHFVPRVEDHVLYKMKDLLWSKQFIDNLFKIKKLDTKGSFYNMNKFWLSLYQVLINEGFTFEEIVRLYYEEDHVRICWQE